MSSLKKLKERLHDIKREKSTMPDHAVPVPRISDKTSNGLTKCIIIFIEYICNGYAVRINTQGQYNESLGTWTKSHTRRGTADIHACINGRHISIEVKTGRDRMSKYQILTKELVEESGGHYMIARSFDTWYEDFVKLFGDYL